MLLNPAKSSKKSSPNTSLDCNPQLTKCLECQSKVEHLNKAIENEYLENRDNITTPLECVEYMLSLIPKDFFNNHIKVLDPCCGFGNFYYHLSKLVEDKNIFNNDINTKRTDIFKSIFKPLNIKNIDLFEIIDKFDLIVANPPYSGGKNKNKSLSNDVIRHCIDICKNNGYLLFITPNNFLSYNNNNTTLKKLLDEGSFIVIDNTAKRFFPKVGSSFCIWLWQKNVYNVETVIKNGYCSNDVQNVIINKNQKFIPLYVSTDIFKIYSKVLCDKNEFKIRCDLHATTNKSKLNINETGEYSYKTIHTPSKTLFANFKQDIYDKFCVIIPLTSYYKPYIINEHNVTQSVGYVSFETYEQALKFKQKIDTPLYKVLIHLTRFGNFNNVKLLKHLNFNFDYNDLTKQEQDLIETLYKNINY